MTKTRALTWGGLLVALHCIVLFLSDYVPGVDLIVTLVLPLFSAMYTIRAPWRNTMIFAFATLLITLLIQPINALLLILPTLVCGIGYGILVKKKAGGTTIVYALAFLNLLLFFTSVYFIDLFYQLDLISSLMRFFHLESNSYRYIAPTFLILYVFAQAFLLHFILKRELKKLRIKVNKSEYPPIALFALFPICFTASFVSFSPSEVNVFLAAASLITVAPLILYGYQQCNRLIALLIVQSVFFLAIALPILNLLSDQNKIAAVTVVFTPVYGYALWRIIHLRFYPTKKEGGR